MTPRKHPQNLHTPKIFVFLKTPKNIETQNFEPQKMSRAYVCKKYQSTPPIRRHLVVGTTSLKQFDIFQIRLRNLV